jgi:hypothetical protein
LADMLTVVMLVEVIVGNVPLTHGCLRLVKLWGSVFWWLMEMMDGCCCS